MCYVSAYTGRPTLTLAFDEQFDILPSHYRGILDICMKKFGVKQIIIDKMAAVLT